MITPAEKKKLLARKAAAINKHFKKTVICTADQAKNPYFLRHPTGIMELDIDLAGGWPPGVSYISGPDGAGKSHLLYRTMAMYQRLNGENSAIALAAVENPIDHMYMRKMGVIISVPDEVIEEKNQWRKDMGLPSYTKDEVRELKRSVGTFWDITGDNMEQTLQAVLNLLSDKDLRTPDCQLGIIGIDSLNALNPKAWANADLDDEKRRAAHAGCITSFFNQLYPLLTSLDDDPLYTSILFTQQVRSNAAKAAAMAHIAKWMPDYAPAPGAYAGRHGKQMDVMIWPGQKVKEVNEDGGKKEIIQKTFSWELLKGKSGTHEGKTGEVPFEFETEDFINLQRTVLVSGMRHGVFKEKDGLITMVNTATGKDSEIIKRIPAQDLIKKMKEDINFEYELRREILAANNIECRYR
jgi:RecA/RadA recombinase